MKLRKKSRTQRALHIKKGDMVVAIAGEDAGRGKPGKVLQVLPKQAKAIVEGYNYVRKHMRKTQDNPQGGIVEKEAPIHVSNLMKFEETAAKPAKKSSAKAEKAS